MKKILFALFILLMGMTSCLTETELVYREPRPRVYVYTYPYNYHYYGYGYPYAYYHYHYKSKPHYHPANPPAPQPPVPPKPKPQVPKATVRPSTPHNSGSAGSMSGRRGNGNSGTRRR